YCPCFDHPFINLDDEGYVTRNRHVAAGLTADGARWAFTTFEKANWHPLTWLSLQLDRTLYGGLKAGGFHVTNVLLHAANVLLLLDYWPLGRLTWRAAGLVAAGQAAGASPAARQTSVPRLLLEKLPLFALALASCVVTFLAQSQGQAVKSLETFPPEARVAN